MDWIAAYVILCSTVVVSEFSRNGRFKRDTVDLDALTDEEIFSLLEKSEDYAFETESPDSFKFEIGDYDEHEASTVKLDISSSQPPDITTEGHRKSTEKAANLTKDSKSETSSPGNYSSPASIQSTTSIVIVTTPHAVATAVGKLEVVTKIPPTSPPITTAAANVDNASFKPTTSMPSTAKHLSQKPTARVKSQETDPATDMVTTTKPKTEIDKSMTTPENVTLTTQKSTYGGTSTVKPPSASKLPPSTEVKPGSTSMANSTTKTPTTRLPITTAETPTTTTEMLTTTTKKHTTTTENPTTTTTKPTTTTKRYTTTTKKPTTTTKKHTTTTKKPTTTTEKPTTTKKPNTKPTTTTKKPSTTTKRHTTTTKKPTTTTKKHTTTTRKPTTTTKRHTTTSKRHTTTTEKPTTTAPVARSQPTAKPPIPKKPFPLEQKCFNLLNPDNTTSNQCFFAQGIYPQEGPNDKTTPRTTSATPRATPPTTPKPSPRPQSGGSPICFSLFNDTSKCFFLNVDPSESPSTEKIATLAPHRVFEITEEPPKPLERVSLKPTLLYHTVQDPDVSAVTPVLLSKDRLYAIPPNVDLGAKRNQNQRGRGSKEPNPPQIQRPWSNENRYGQNELRGFQQITTPRPRWAPVAPPRPQSPSKGGSFVRFGPRKTVYQPPETLPGQRSEDFNPRRPGSQSGFLYVGNSGVPQTRGRPADSNYPERHFIQYPPQGRDPASDIRTSHGSQEQHFIVSSDSRDKPRLILVARPSYNLGSINNIRPRPDSQQAPTDQDRSNQPGVSNIRIKIPNQGTFSQTAVISSHDPQRSVYERIYFDVVRERAPPPDPKFDSRQNHQRAKRSAKAEIPIDETEGITLGFVVDTTASMGTELNEVKKYALIIMNEVLNNRGSHIENFVFVPIHDEDPVHERLWLLTRNRDDMSRTISQIRVAGGGTCPENSLVGLLKAIELAEKDSHIFVFTDAFAQDYHLVPDVIRSIQRKKPRIYFLLTGECKKALNDDQRYAFDRIATASTGIVARLNKDSSQLRTVLEAVELEFEKNRRIVTEAEGEPTGSRPRDIKIQVDPKLTNLSVTSTGRNTKIDVVGPRGRPRDIVKVLDMPNIQIVFVPKPDPGEWTVSVTSPESPFKIVASGISTTDFLYGFSVTQTNQTSHLSKHPKQGVPNYILLVAKDPSVLYNISSVQLVSGSTIFEEIEVTAVNYEQGIYRTGPLVFPDTSFKMRINAYTLDGYPLTRLTKATIIPQEPGPPEIDCKRSMVATAGLPFNMTCSIESLIPMVIQMYKEGNPLSHPLQYSQSSTVILQFSRLEAKDGGNYIVDARNAAGSALQYVNLIVKEEPPSLELEPNFITAPGKRQVIYCQVSSLTEYSLVWMKSDSPPDNFYAYGLYDLQSNSNNIKIEGDQIVIDPVRPENEGWYVCTARNGGGEGQARSYLVIREPPIVSIDNAKEGGVIQFTKDTRVMLSCRTVKGIPTVALGWYDTFGRPIQNGVNKKMVRQEFNSLHLILHGATVSDEGTYICSGENLAGRDSKKVKLQYVEKPVVTARKNRVELVDGERLSLECILTGIPEPNVTWSRITAYDTMPVPILSSRKDLPGRYLELEEVTTHDSGTYICRGANEWGTHEVKILVAVGQKPLIYGLAKTYSADINRVAEIRCTASGVPAPSISWRKSDGTPVRGIVQMGVLTIEHAKLEDAGIYVCTSQNKFGRAEAATVLSIRGEPPKVTCSPDSYQFVLGELAEIQCNVTGEPAADVKWFRNGTEMDATSNDGRLQFRALNEAAGRIEIFATNEAGNASATVNILIYEQPSFSRDAPTTMEAIVGSNVSLPCRTTGNPPPEVTWDIFNFPVIPNKLVFNPASGSLEIFNVDVEDEGTYTCRAKNKAGQRAHTITLEVLSPPQAKLVSWDLHEGSIRERKELTLVCHVKGKPEPQISWTRDGLPLPDSSNFTISRNKLKFFTSVSSSGLYACHARNSAGQETRSIYVNVTAAPSIENPEDQSVSGLEGDEIILSCVVHGNPVPEVTWNRRDEELQAFPEFIISDGNLIIPSLSVDMEGTFSCVAKNFLGQAEKVFRVSVNSVPRIESDAPTDVEVYQFDDYAIPCRADGKPKPSIHWNIGNGPSSQLQNSDKFKVHQDGTLLLYNVQVEDVGPVTCYAENSVGLDRRTHQVRVVVPSSLTTHLQNLLAENTSATVKDVPEAGTMRLECPAPKGQLVEWLKDDQPLKIAAPERADDPHYNVKADSRILLINDAVDTDIGKYTCVYPPTGRHDFFVNVLAKPYFYSHDGLLPPEIYQLQDGQSVVVNCSARGNPEPTVSWQRLDSTGGWIPFTNYTLKGVQFVGRRNEILSIPEVRWAHNGTYKCTARSRLGKHSRTFAISWSGPPQVMGERTVEKKIPAGKPVSLICQIEGSPQLEFVWEFQSQGKTYRLPNADRNLTLPNVNTDNAGMYRCKATNAAGIAEQAFILRVVVPPILSRASVTSLTYRPYEDIELKCTSRGLDQDEDIIWMKGDFLLSRSDRVSLSTSKFSNGKSYYLKLINAQEDDTDTYKCVLFNKAGKTQQLFEILVLNRP